MNAGADRHALTRSWGAELIDGDAVRFRVWAPGQQRVGLVLGDKHVSMRRDDDGWFETVAPGVAPGSPYQFLLEDGIAVPDPASRAQVGTVHGPSLVTDPKSYEWLNADWRGRPWEEAVIYELHVGTYTPEGTFQAAREKLAYLAELGVTAIELMPVAQFSGDRGWGYDGVLLYAPHPAYGSPEDMKSFIDDAHSLGLMVLLDVVYNHFGPDGNYLHSYAPDFFHPEKHTPWGAAIAYDRDPVRRFFIENALYWLEEFCLDGLRFDAIDNIRDEGSHPEFMVEIAERIRAGIKDRYIHLTTEDNRNVTHLHKRGPRGEVIRHTAEWNDDVHNVLHVIATGETEGYYEDFAEDVWAKLGRALAEGYVYQGDESEHAGRKPRGEASSHLPPTAFIDFLQNHDQVGNRALGERLPLLADERTLQLMTAMLLLSPHVPLLFMGEEYGETRPFYFFTDFSGDLARAVREGRRREFAGFAAFQGHKEDIPDPNALSTFTASKLGWEVLETAAAQRHLERVKHLLSLRRDHIVGPLSKVGGHAGRVLAAADGLLAIEWKLGDATLSLRANFSSDLQSIEPAPGKAFYVDALEGVDPARGDLPARSIVFSMN